MKVTLLVVGRTASGYVKSGIDDYAARLKHYTTFEMVHVSDARNTRSQSQEAQKVAEGQQLLAAVGPSDYMVLLDERGTEHSSSGFAQYVQKRLSSGVKRVVFVVGGPYGFSDEVYARANDRVSLSRLTFPHDLVRLIFVEQLYRAFTILRNEPYHHS